MPDEHLFKSLPAAWRTLELWRAGYNTHDPMRASPGSSLLPVPAGPPRAPTPTDAGMTEGTKGQGRSHLYPFTGCELEGSWYSFTADEGAGMGKPNRIFIAHASEDKARVKPLYDKLKAEGYDPWLDAVDILAGQPWKTEIPKAIRQAGIFLACFSKISVTKSGYVQKELLFALDRYSERLLSGSRVVA